jgi:tetratricopeptide (TPR) repeat protein/tRNA A-37 threonylcarbamoyl transferase component Bud32
MTSPNTERDPVEALAAEFMERQRRGQRPNVEEYTAAHPELAEQIRGLFPTIAALEDWKHDHTPLRPRPGLAALGNLTHLGDYRLIREIGRGGMGIVYEAEQQSLGRRVAVKVLPQGPLLQEKQRQRFEREAKTAARLHHTNIVPVFGVGEQDGVCYYVMQLIPGVSLDRVIAASRRDGTSVLGEPFTTEHCKAATRLALQVADALDYAHSQNVWHRDIKPANLLLDAAGMVWVADFGLAKVLEQDGASATGDVVGTLQYMAPEQFHGRLDGRSDLCSLGLTLYELLTLQPAFHGASRTRLIHQILHEEPPRPRTLNPAIPRDLETIVLKATARDPERRYQTARDLHDDLRRYLEDRPIHARRMGPGERLLRWCRRNPAVAGLTAVAAVLLVLVAAVATDGYLQTCGALERESHQRHLTDDALRRETEERLRAEGLSQQETKQRQRAEEISREEIQQRLRAEATVGLSLEVLEEIFERLAPARVVAPCQLTLTGGGDETVEVALQPTVSPETAAMLEKLLLFYDRLAQQGADDSKVRRQAARATRRVGDIRLHLGLTAQALEDYERAARLYRDLADQLPRDAVLTAERAGVHIALGQAFRKNNEFDKARAAQGTAIQVLLAAGLPQGPPAVVRYELAQAHFHLGTMAREQPGPPKDGGPKKDSSGSNRPTDADVDLGKAIGLLKDLVREDVTAPAYRHLLALCYREKSKCFMGRNLKLDWNDRKEAIGLLEQLVKEYPRVPEYRFVLAETLAQMELRGPTLQFPGPDSTDKDLLEALRLSRGLVTEHPNVPDYQVSKAQIHYKLAHVQRQNHQVEKAEKNLYQAVELQNSLAQLFPKVSFHRFMNIVFQDALAEVLMEQKKWQESRPLLETSIKQLKKLIRQEPDLVFLNNPLADNYGRLAKTLNALGERELASDADRQAREIRQALPKGRGKGK